MSFQSFSKDYKESDCGKKSKKSRSSGSVIPEDSAYLGDSRSRLPTSTTGWDIFCLDKVGIYYHDKYLSSPSDVLDIAYQKTGCFKPLNELQKKYIAALDRSLSFSFPMEEFEMIAKQSKSPENSLQESILIDLKRDLQAIRNDSKVQSPVVHSVAEEFLTDVTNVIRFEIAYHKGGRSRRNQGPVTKDLYVSVFDHFARMCCVSVLPGSLWRSEMKIKKQEVSSTADRLILPVDFSSETRLGNPDSDSVAVVSVVEVKKAAVKKEVVPQIKRLTKENLASLEANIDSENLDEVSEEKKVRIDDRIDPQILGQHGGELLMHIPFYEQKLDSEYLKYFPGMIVIGTEVTFTVLETNGTHLNEVSTKEDVYKKATIYYSEPKDMLKKEDRGILMESIMRLNNV